MHAGDEPTAQLHGLSVNYIPSPGAPRLCQEESGLETSQGLHTMRQNWETWRTVTGPEPRSRNLPLAG